nr:7TM-DISM domain-containing protein [Emticicia fluvialis]
MIDSSGSMSIQEAMLNPGFKKLKGWMINFGSNPSYLWLKVTIANQSAASGDFILFTKGVDS